MLTESELQAILVLLDDSDDEVLEAIESRLFSEGASIIPQLETLWVGNDDPVKAARIEQIIQNINHRDLGMRFENWMHSEQRDLLEACLLVGRIQYPGLNEAVVNNYLDKVRLDAWMALYSAGNPLDRVKILNHILFERNGIAGNQSNYHAPDNSFLHKVIETRAGNPITLSCLYSILAQRLGMPVFGVNLPQHFILAWCEEETPGISDSYNAPKSLNRSDYGKVLFYINPFSNGQIFLKKNIDDFLEAIKTQPRQEFYEPCNNLEIIRRVLRNLHFSYGELQNKEKINRISDYMNILGMRGESASNDEDEN